MNTSNFTRRDLQLSILPTFQSSILLLTLLLAAFAPQAEAVMAEGGSITNYVENGTNFTAHVFKTAGTNSTTYSIEFGVGGSSGGSISATIIR